ncbi:O-antigen ligase [Aquabacterium sp.]|uniref:O-antigen ligase family protein n=1 Tax=Aquabacterium sp. TaxID=1872578 RepID=UPI0025B8C7F5|nr:O-antigen ligase family protein [Aquabacterium sp.]
MSSAARFFPLLAGLLFGALMVFAGPPIGMLAAVAVAAAVYIASQPVRGLLLFCLLAPALPWMTLTLGIRITTSEALLALTWVGVFFQWLAGNLPALPRGPTERAMLRFMAWTVVPLVAGQFFVPGEGIGPVNWARYLLNISPVFLLPLLANKAAERERLLLCLLLGFAGLVAIALGFFLKGRDAREMIPFLTALQYARPDAIADIFGADPTRMASPWVHPNNTGGALLLGAPLGLFYGIVHTGWRRALGFFVFLGGVAGIVFCGSRGALLALGVFVVWLAWKKTPYAGRGLLVSAILAVALVATYAPAHKRFASLFSSNDVSTGVRFDEYAHFPGNALRYPLGMGFRADTPASSPEKGVYGISNLWLNYWFKLGLPGMLFFIGVTLAWWREVRIPGTFERVNAANALRIATVGTVLAALTTGFIDHYFSFTQVLISLFWLIVALGLQQARVAPASRFPEGARP